jgi:GMP synthase-like glutamine amidotransferase
MRVLILEHDHLSPPGPIAERFAEHGYEIVEQVVVPPDRFGDPNVTFDFPDPSEFDAIVPMGAPWGAWDDATIGNWLLPEIDWLRRADREAVPVLGICFGGQLLARVHGGSVARAPRPEIGWAALWTSRPEIVSPGPWFQFHYDRWVVPPGAEEIARNSLASQSFILRRNLAVQFHPELTAAGLLGWINNDGKALIEADGQDPDILYQHMAAEEDAAAERAHRLVDAFLEHVAGAAAAGRASERT